MDDYESNEDEHQLAIHFCTCQSFLVAVDAFTSTPQSQDNFVGSCSVNRGHPASGLCPTATNDEWALVV